MPPVLAAEPTQEHSLGGAISMQIAPLFLILLFPG